MKKYLVILILAGVSGILFWAQTEHHSSAITHKAQSLSIDEIHIPTVERGIYYLMPHVPPNDWEKAELLAETLDILEPGGAHGQVQVGAMMRVSIYDYLSVTDGQWSVDTSGFSRLLEAAVSINRPVVIYLAGDHFASWSTSLAELNRDEKNLMQVRGGGVLHETYFKQPLNTASILIDKTLPIFIAKKQILGELAKVVAQFYRDHPELLVGVVLNGETHFLFKDFYSGTGVVKNAVLTDYSPLALQQFQQYLISVGEYDLKADDIVAIDYNLFEHGVLPIEGWLDADNAREISAVDAVFPQYPINIYINGQSQARITTSLNRLDVYQARPGGNNPNVGFRYNWDFSNVPAGEYVIQATITEESGQEYEIGRRTVTVMTRDNTLNEPVSATSLNFLSLSSSGYTGYLDRPQSDSVVSYLPLARYWLAFREKVIVDHVNFMSEILREHQVPDTLMYSYQLTPWMVGGWNPVLFGVGEDFFHETDANPGVTLYGGNTLNPDLFQNLPEAKPYVIPEWHPQLDRSPMVPLASLYMHYKQGAKFVAPYYLTTHDLWPVVNFDPSANRDSHERMMIAPNNPLMGSRYVYEAIVKFAEM